jgi:hypothetical protein
MTMGKGNTNSGEATEKREIPLGGPLSRGRKALAITAPKDWVDALMNGI